MHRRPGVFSGDRAGFGLGPAAQEFLFLTAPPGGAIRRLRHVLPGEIPGRVAHERSGSS